MISSSSLSSPDQNQLKRNELPEYIPFLDPFQELSISESVSPLVISKSEISLSSEMKSRALFSTFKIFDVSSDASKIVSKEKWIFSPTTSYVARVSRMSSFEEFQNLFFGVLYGV